MEGFFPGSVLKAPGTTSGIPCLTTVRRKQMKRERDRRKRTSVSHGRGEDERRIRD